MSVNKAILIGRLGADPEVRYTQGGTAVANFNIATSETFTDKSGQRQERTEWHRIVVWNRQAEICGEYLRKGREVYVEGRIETREWEDQEGKKRYTTEIKAQTVQFLSSGQQGDQGGRGGEQGAGRSGGYGQHPGQSSGGYGQQPGQGGGGHGQQPGQAREQNPPAGQGAPRW